MLDTGIRVGDYFWYCDPKISLELVATEVTENTVKAHITQIDLEFKLTDNRLFYNKADGIAFYLEMENLKNEVRKKSKEVDEIIAKIKGLDGAEYVR